MGHGDDDELMPNDQALAEAELQTRRILSRWGEPSAVEPPAALAAQVAARINGRRPGPQRSLRATLRLLWIGLAAAGLGLGTWGVFASPLDVAALFGGPDALLGRVFLAAILVAKPLVNLLLNSMAVVSLGIAVAVAVLWLWWRIVRVGPHPEVS